MSEHNHPPAIPEHGLQDNCPRCAEHAAHPAQSLDDGNLRRLVERTQAWLRDEDFAYPRSETEAKAMRVVERHLVFVQHAKRIGVVL
jgi:anti-sigma-K factor RskA